MRKTMAVDSTASNNQRKSVMNSIARASVKFELKDGTEAGELVIENERLKTTIMVLNNKLKVQDDTEKSNARLLKLQRQYEDEIDEYKADIDGLKINVS